LPKFGPKIVVPIGLLMAAIALFLLHRLGLHSSYLTHVLPYMVLLGLGFGLSYAPSFSTGTVGLQPDDAGVGSATLNTSQQVGGSIGTALLNTLAAGAATAYLVGRVANPTNIKLAALHSYTTAFLWSSLILAAGAVIAGLLLPPGNLKKIVGPSREGRRRPFPRTRSATSLLSATSQSTHLGQSMLPDDRMQPTASFVQR
jgi:sugar phosphate permease